MKRTLLTLSALILLAVIFAVVGKTVTQETSAANQSATGDQWEYLIVAGANINLTPSNNPSLRKEPSSGFSREAFVLEQNMDKLGAKGWELVSISGASGDPVFYFKRRK